MSSSALTLSVDPVTLARLEKAAADRGMTREALVEVAVSDFLTEQAVDAGVPLQPWQEAMVREGLAAADRGDFASVDDVERVFAKYRAR